MLDWLFELPRTSPVAHAIGLIALVSAAGMAVGSIKFKGIGLGSAGVLFIGILIAQFSEPMESHTLVFVREFGLVLFVFTIGLQLGPGFFASLRAEGLRLNLLAAALVLLAAGLAPTLGWLLGLDLAAVAGLFAGASTNTPALGTAQQALATVEGITPERLALPALACAVVYPAAIGGLLGTLIMPQNANHAFREFGVSLFFATLGLAAGDQFFAAALSPQGLVWLATGTVVSVVPILAVGIWARVVSKLNFVTLGGLLSGGMTNPPALAFVSNLCGSDAPGVAYATVYPLTTLLRILIAQLLVLLLCR